MKNQNLINVPSGNRLRRCLRKTIAFSAALILLCTCLTACSNARSNPITNVHNLNGQRIGVGLAWGPDYLLTGREDLKLMRYNSVAGAITALCYHQVDAVAVEQQLVPGILSSVTGLRCIEEPIAEDAMGFLVSPDDPELLAELNAFIDSFVTTPEYEDLLARSRAPEGYQFREVPLLGGDRVLTVGAVSESYPYSYPNSETERFEGLDVEFLCHFANACGYSLKFHGDVWESMELGVEYGKYDLGCGGISELYRADIEESGTLFMSACYLPVSIVFIVREDDYAHTVLTPIDY